nr:single-stranded DNA-binding protein [Mucilaginibacter sp. L294]
MLSNSGINKVLLLGQVTGHPFINKTDKTESYLCFTLVTNELIKKGVDNVGHNEYHKIKMPEKLLQQEGLNLEEGHTLFIEGKIHTTTIIDAERIKRYNLEIIVSKVELISIVPVAV